MTLNHGKFALPCMEVASVRVKRKMCDMQEERRGMAKGKQTAPAFMDMKPQSCFWLMLPESGGGARGVLLSDVKQNFNTHYHDDQVLKQLLPREIKTNGKLSECSNN